MALITCSECGRAVSSRATVCIGCGAPLASVSAFDMAPKRSVTPPPTARQVKWRVVAALATLVLGIVWSSALDHRHGSSRIAVTFAALLVISGLCGFVVALLQGVALRK